MLGVGHHRGMNAAAQNGVVIGTLSETGVRFVVRTRLGRLWSSLTLGCYATAAHVDAHVDVAETRDGYTLFQRAPVSLGQIERQEWTKERGKVIL